MDGGEEVAHQEKTEGWVPPPLCIPSGGRRRWGRAVRSSLSGRAASPAAGFISAMLIGCSAN